MGGDMKIKGSFMAVVLLFTLSRGVEGIAQVNSSIGGTVEDTSKALIPGVTVAATSDEHADRCHQHDDHE
jgi:hypothetical protein